MHIYYLWSFNFKWPLVKRSQLFPSLHFGLSRDYFTNKVVIIYLLSDGVPKRRRRRHKFFPVKASKQNYINHNITFYHKPYFSTRHQNILNSRWFKSYRISLKVIFWIGWILSYYILHLPWVSYVAEVKTPRGPVKDTTGSADDRQKIILVETNI